MEIFAGFTAWRVTLTRHSGLIFTFYDNRPRTYVFITEYYHEGQMFRRIKKQLRYIWLYFLQHDEIFVYREVCLNKLAGSTLAAVLASVHWTNWRKFDWKNMATNQHLRDWDTITATSTSYIFAEVILKSNVKGWRYLEGFYEFKAVNVTCAIAKS